MKRRKDELFTSSFGDVVAAKSHRATKRQVSQQKAKNKREDR